MKWFKRTISLFLIIFIILIVAAVAFLNTFNPNQYKHSINTALTQMVGHKTNIKGPIVLQYFPSIGLQIKHIEISDKEGVIAKIGMIKAHLALIPLLHKHFLINKASLKNAEFVIRINNQGESNWISNRKITSSTQPSSKNTSSSTKVSKSTTNSTNADFELKKISISNANMTIITPFSRLDVKAFNFTGSNFSFDREFSYTLNTKLSGNLNKHPFSTSFSMKGNLIFNNTHKNNDTASLGVSTKSSLELKTLKYDKLIAKNMSAILHLSDKNYRIDLNALNAYEGLAKGFIQYNQNTKALNLEGTITKINIGHLLKDLNNITFLQGGLSGQLNIKSLGNNRPDILNHLNGRAKVSVANGELNAIDIDGIVRWVDSLLLNKQSLKTVLSTLSDKAGPHLLFNKKATPFQFLSGEATITNGIALFKSINMHSETLEVKGDGTISIKGQTLDFSLSAGTKDNNEATTQLNKTFHTGIPFRVYGPLSAPHVRPDYKSITQKLGVRLLDNVTKDVGGSLKNINKTLKQFKSILK
jgi:uncharacterized protein involved in outer membrane biogenesis